MDDRIAPPRTAELKTAVIGGPAPPAPPTSERTLSDTRLSALPHAVDHYDLLEQLGRGGCGIVYKAFDCKLRREVAVKTMTPELAADASARQRFVREARAAAAVRHENVVQIHAVEDGSAPYLVMEYVPGASLHRHLTEFGALSPADVLRIGAQVARGLAAAHDCGLIHRDVKPANILVEWPDGRPRAKLADFGIARAADAIGLTRRGTVVGTPQYMSPEQARGESLDHRSDLYSLGSVLYELTAGHAPFDADSGSVVVRRVAESSPPPLGDAAPGAPVWLCAIVAKLQARRPADRFQTARAAAELIENCLSQLDAGDSVQLPAAFTARRRAWWPYGVAAAFALAAVAAAVFACTPEPKPDPAPAVEPAAPARAPEPVVAPPRRPEPLAVTAPQGPVERYTNAVGMHFARVPRGTSWLGGGGGRPGHRRLDVPADYYLGIFEVTRGEWEKVLGPGTCPPSAFDAHTPSERAAVARRPVSGVSWNDSQIFLRALNRQCPEAGWTYRLPRVTEWEYACRGGPDRPLAELACDYYVGEPSTDANPERVSCRESGLGRPSAVGSFLPNRLGLHDMHGNVFELLDTGEGDVRWLAGGCWTDDLAKTKATSQFGINRAHRMPGGGLRVVRVPAEPGDVPAGVATSVAADLVANALRKANPLFKGTVTARMVDGWVREVRVENGADLTDLTPLASYRTLDALSLPGAPVKDLSPLKGLPLRQLDLNGNTVVTDLSPLKGMPLEVLTMWGFQGDDLSPLKGMPLKELNCGGGGKRFDLTPLNGMPLRELGLNHTAVDDLSPLKGLPLEVLMAGPTKVTDLSPLAGMKLKQLYLDGAPVTDFGPIKGLPLEAIGLTYSAERDGAILRAIPTLKEINKKPAAEFLSDR